VRSLKLVAASGQLWIASDHVSSILQGTKRSELDFYRGHLLVFEFK
jgi:hypothetical protein